MPCELTQPLTAEEEGLWRERLTAQLARQVALYTANESSSVPAAIARELLHGVLFCLAVPEEETARAPRIRELLSLDLEDALSRGQERTRRDAALTLALWRGIVRSRLLENRALHDTLRSIGRGFRRYDTRFFPQHFPCSIDYPLSLPVSEQLLGIRYVNRYLTHLAAECVLLARLPRKEIGAVLERSCPDWRGLVVNLYTPVAANALARTLLGAGGTLTLTDSEVEALRRRWEHVRPPQLEAELLRAADERAEQLTLPRGAAAYLRAAARETALRATALRDCGGLRGIFV